MKPEKLASLFLLFGMIAVSFAAVLIRLAAAPAAVTAFYRMAFAAGLLVPLLPRYWSSYVRLKWRHIGLIMISGLLLALHLLIWIRSFDHTSVASSVFLVATQPIFVTIASIWLFREKPRPVLVLGIGLALAGTLWIARGDFAGGQTSLVGSLLALTGAVFASGYLLTGRYVRQNVALPLGAYVLAVYSLAAVALGLYLWAIGEPFTGYSGRTWSAFFLLGLIPTVIGHTAFNWALKYLPASLVSTAILGEPVGATLLAWLLLGEAAGTYALTGGALILCGIYLVIGRASIGRRPVAHPT